MRIAHALAQSPGHRVEIWSGRGEGEGASVRRKTLAWLRRHAGISVRNLGDGKEAPPWGFEIERLLMRAHSDHTPDHELKRRWLHEVRSLESTVDVVFDDRDRVVAMWREEGVPCFQVAPGAF